MTSPIRVNGLPVVVMKNRGYYPYFAHPGTSEVSGGSGKTATVTLEVEAGKTYYVRCSYSPGFGGAKIHLRQVSAEHGDKELVKCQLLK